MAKIPCKGTAVKIEIATVLTAVAQIVSLDVGENDPETYDAATLDQADNGKHKGLTGYVAGGDVSGELFFDPANAGHATLHGLSSTPVPTAGQVAFADGDTSLDFDVVAVKLGFAVKLNDGLKSKFTFVLDGPGVLTVA